MYVIFAQDLTCCTDSGEFFLGCFTPDEVLSLPRHAAATSPKVPCELLFARISANMYGVSLSASPSQSTSILSRWAETVYGWTLSSKAMKSTTKVAPPIPIDLVFERLFLGCIPATALRMALLSTVVLPIVLLVMAPMQRVMLRHAEKQA